MVNIRKRQEILTSNYVSPSIAYSVTYNTQQNYQDRDFTFFKFRLSTSGNLSSLISQEKKLGFKTLFDIPIAQYIKADIEYKKFWKTLKSNTIATRLFYWGCYSLWQHG